MSVNVYVCVRPDASSNVVCPKGLQLASAAESFAWAAAPARGAASGAAAQLHSCTTAQLHRGSRSSPIPQRLRARPQCEAQQPREPDSPGSKDLKEGSLHKKSQLQSNSATHNTPRKKSRVLRGAIQGPSPLCLFAPKPQGLQCNLSPSSDPVYKFLDFSRNLPATTAQPTLQPQNSNPPLKRNMPRKVPV